jgi:hypothetical protein
MASSISCVLAVRKYSSKGMIDQNYAMQEILQARCDTNKQRKHESLGYNYTTH